MRTRITNISAMPVQIAADGGLLDVGATETLDTGDEYVTRALERNLVHDLGPEPTVDASKTQKERG